MLKQAMDLQQQQGEAALQMLQGAARIQNVAAAEPGKGQLVDVTA